MTGDGRHRILRTDEVTGIVAEIPDGHRHLRTTLQLSDGSSVTLQEATLAALVRAYVTVTTDPCRHRIELKGRLLAERKDGYAGWQLVEED